MRTAFPLLLPHTIAGGNQREQDRAKAQKKLAAGKVKKESGASLQKRKEADAAALREKQQVRTRPSPRVRCGLTLRRKRRRKRPRRAARATAGNNTAPPWAIEPYVSPPVHLYLLSGTSRVFCSHRSNSLGRRHRTEPIARPDSHDLLEGIFSGCGPAAEIHSSLRAISGRTSHTTASVANTLLSESREPSISSAKTAVSAKRSRGKH